MYDDRLKEIEKRKKGTLKICNAWLDRLGVTQFLTLRDPCLDRDPYFGKHSCATCTLTMQLNRAHLHVVVQLCMIFLHTRVKQLLDEPRTAQTNGVDLFSC